MILVEVNEVWNVEVKVTEKTLREIDRTKVCNSRNESRALVGPKSKLAWSFYLLVRHLRQHRTLSRGHGSSARKMFGWDFTIFGRI